MSWISISALSLLFSSFVSFGQLILFNNRKCIRISRGFNDGTYGRPYYAEVNIAHDSCRPKGAAFTQTLST